MRLLIIGTINNHKLSPFTQKIGKQLKVDLIKKITLCMSILLIQNAQAGLVSELKITGNIVTFKTSATKSNTALACIDDAKKAYWSTDLSTDAGRAMYSSLVTAISTKTNVAVTSNQACLLGYEQAGSLALTNIDTGDDTVRWAGLTQVFDGKLVTHKDYAHPMSSFNAKCEAAYSGSRAMSWEDYLKVKAVFPHDKSVWMYDAIDNISIAESRNSYSYSRVALIIYKSGRIERIHEGPKSESDFLLRFLPGNFNCANYAENTQYHPENQGVILQQGRLIRTSCGSRHAIACVR